MLCKRCNANEVCEKRSKRHCEKCLGELLAIVHKYRNKDRESFNKRMRFYNREYRKNHLEEVRFFDREYKKSSKGKAYRRAYQERNKSEIRKRKIEWDKNNPEKLSLYYKKYNSNNPSRIIHNHKRRAKSDFSWSAWIELCKKFGNKCLWCEKVGRKLTIDHVVPVTKGGTNDIENLQPLCKSCNSRKNNKTLDFRPFGSAIMEWT